MKFSAIINFVRSKLYDTRAFTMEKRRQLSLAVGAILNLNKGNPLDSWKSDGC